MTTTPCKKCHGTGTLPSLSHVQFGLCFRCMGTGVALAPADRLERAIAQCDAHLAELIEVGTRYAAFAATRPERPHQQLEFTRATYRKVRADRAAFIALRSAPRITLAAIRAINPLAA